MISAVSAAAAACRYECSIVLYTEQTLASRGAPVVVARLYSLSIQASHADTHALSIHQEPSRKPAQSLPVDLASLSPDRLRHYWDSALLDLLTSPGRVVRSMHASS